MNALLLLLNSIEHVDESKYHIHILDFFFAKILLAIEKAYFFYKCRKCRFTKVNVEKKIKLNKCIN